MERNEEEFLVANSSKNYSQESSNSAQKTNWRFVMRIAALFILVLIPVGISVFFFNQNSGSGLGEDSKTNKEENNTIYAETGDLTDLKNINLPSASFSVGNTILQPVQRTQGLANLDVEISINIISYLNQLAFLEEKIQKIDSKYQELKNKKIKNKKSTLQSLKETQEKCILKKNELLALESTYEFKNEKLQLFRKEKIDLKTIKVYFIQNEEETRSYYLRRGDDYFYLSTQKGKLKKVVESDILEQLEDI
jgi:hypothetical protein